VAFGALFISCGDTDRVVMAPGTIIGDFHVHRVIEIGSLIEVGHGIDPDDFRQFRSLSRKQDEQANKQHSNRADDPFEGFHHLPPFPSSVPARCPGGYPGTMLFVFKTGIRSIFWRLENIGFSLFLSLEDILIYNGEADKETDADQVFNGLDIIIEIHKGVDFFVISDGTEEKLSQFYHWLVSFLTYGSV
jgi:hypothetical protein